MSYGYCTVFCKGFICLVQRLCVTLVVSWGKYCASLSLSFSIYKMGMVVPTTIYKVLVPVRSSGSFVLTAIYDFSLNCGWF